MMHVTSKPPHKFTFVHDPLSEAESQEDEVRNPMRNSPFSRTIVCALRWNSLGGVGRWGVQADRAASYRQVKNDDYKHNNVVSLSKAWCYARLVS